LILQIAGIVIALFLAYLAVAVAANALMPIDAMALEVRQSDLPQVPATGFGLSSWNIGYAGLGEESEFLVDGGNKLLPPSGAVVRKNIDGIVSVVDDLKADVFLFQEAANASVLTYGIDVRGHLESRLAQFGRTYATNALTRLIPPPFRIDHGSELFSRYRIDGARWEPLPSDGDAFYGILRKAYGLQIVDLTDAAGRPWTIVNIHLAAFDKNGTARKEQMRVAVARADEIYRQGRHVVVGGDWNLILAKTDFPNNTDPKFLFWVFDFPHDVLPAGWRLAVDPSVPTVRTNYQPYRRGENYTAVIDGFLVSPNVEVRQVHTKDLGFRYSDHQPVSIDVAAKEP
jgi:endonuclease/exonuclease/phosphatase family metal-dependent hydrolase